MVDQQDLRRLALLEEFAAAWNRHDVNALMSAMTDDCVFKSTAGPTASGAVYEGRDAVRAAFAGVWQAFPDAQWNGPTHFVASDRAVSEWVFTGTRLDGTRVEAEGCDIFTFRGDKIAVKNSYRKTVSIK